MTAKIVPVTAPASLWRNSTPREITERNFWMSEQSVPPDATRTAVAVTLLHMNALEGWKSSPLWAEDMITRRRDQPHTNDCEGHSGGCVRCHIEHAFACTDAVLTRLDEVAAR